MMEINLARTTRVIKSPTSVCAYNAASTIMPPVELEAAEPRPDIVVKLIAKAEPKVFATGEKESDMCLYRTENQKMSST